MISQVLVTFFKIPNLYLLVESALRYVPIGVVFLACIQMTTQLKKKPSCFLGCLLLQMKVSSDRYITARMLSQWLRIPIKIILTSENSCLKSLKFSVHISKNRHLLWISKFNVYLRKLYLEEDFKQWLSCSMLIIPTDYDCYFEPASYPKQFGSFDPFDPQGFVVK
eukprot:NODE_159_length_15043_cov_0.440444.p10 type:complete len:166 gc:universal NODE_159_length_15043_cov_0.440444:13084-13581(+)